MSPHPPTHLMGSTLQENRRGILKAEHPYGRSARFQFFMPSAQRSHWKLGFLAGLAVALVAMIPQINLWVARGSNWQGSYAYTDPDELAYSAYLNSIISGSPRSNNPYLGGVEANASPSETF